MNNLLFYVVVGIGGIFVARKFLLRKDAGQLTQHYDAQEQLQRIKTISSAVENNAAPAFAMIGNMPFVTQMRDLIQSPTGGGTQELQVPARVSSL